MPDILHFWRIKAPPERVYAAIASAEGVRGWWTRDSALDAEVGGAGEFAFYDRKVVTRVRIDELRPGAAVAWTVTASGAPGGWEGSTVRFDLEADGDETALRFAHRGLRHADDGFARVTSGWAFYLASLRQYVETGAGVPHPETGILRIVT